MTLDRDFSPLARVAARPVSLWAREPRHVANRAGWAMARGGKLALWSLGRTPVWGWNLVVVEARGAGRITAGAYRWARDFEAQAAIGKEMESHHKTREIRALRERQRTRWHVLLACAGIAALAVAVAVYRYGHLGWVVPVLGLLVLCALVGYRPGEPIVDDLPATGPLHRGVPISRLKASVVEVLAQVKVDAAVSDLHATEHGFEGQLHTPGQRVNDERLRALERGLHAPPDSILLVPDQRNAAQQTMHILLTDPLAGVGMAPKRTPRSMTVADPLGLGRHMDGSELRLRLLRTHVALIGKTGSGKSSGLWALIDGLSACRDVRLHGIDLSDGPALPAWRQVIERYATDPDQASELLDDALRIVRERTAELRRLVESDEPGVDENWNPSVGHPQLVVVVDEFALMTDHKELISRVVEIARTGRKAAVTLLLASQKAGKDDFGATVLRTMIGCKLLMSCEIGDISTLLGGGHADLGWRPDRLKPAQGKNPADAGKVYVYDGDHHTPEPARLYRMDVDEVRARARERISGEIAPAEREPAVLRVLRDAFAHHGTDALPTTAVVEFARDRWRPDVTPELLSAWLKPHGVSPKQSRQIVPGKVARGYLLADLPVTGAGTPPVTPVESVTPSRDAVTAVPGADAA